MSARKPRKFAVQRAAAPNSEINVTPLVDVVLVLLIIFMVVTPLLEKDLEVKVPDTEKIEDTSQIPPDQLIVSLDAESKIKINAESISDADYSERLKKFLAAKKKDDRLVFFMPDEKASYGKLIFALDGAKLAGAEILGMMTEIPEGAQTQPGGASPVPTDGSVPVPPAPAPTTGSTGQP
jgi:biopolymer transport protein TolR